MEAIPKDRSEEHKHNYGKDQVIAELSDKGRYVSACGICGFSVRVLTEAFSDRPVDRVVYDCRGKECDRTSEQNKPRSAEDAVKGGIIVCGRRNDACHEENEAS